MQCHYPLMLDVTRRLIVIVGGGAVASRKADGLVRAGASRVRVVAKRFSDDIPEGVERINEPYRAEHLDGASLVFAATDSPQVNDDVVRDARIRGILVNRADVAEDERGDFIVPAVARVGAITVAVAAEGSPALAARIRDELSRTIDSWTAQADAIGSLRPIIQRSVSDPIRRRQILRDLASVEASDALSKGADALRDWLIEHYPELKSVLET